MPARTESDGPAEPIGPGTRAPVLARLDRADLRAPDAALRAEWLETNGLGDFASGTVLGAPTRRYHGLLVARPEGLAKRHVFLARFEERAVSPEGSVALSMARFGDTWAPDGWRALESFTLRPWPCARYRTGSGRVRRELLLPRGRRAVLVRWTVEDSPCQLELRPLLAFREADALTWENDAFDRRVEPLERGFRVRPYAALPALDFVLAGTPFQLAVDPVWYRGLTYDEDARRGYDAIEDQFCPGVLRVRLRPGAALTLAAGLDEELDPEALWDEETERRSARIAGLDSTDVVARASLSAEDFLFETPERRLGVVAGYPWFDEWGRDTFIALPGLTLARGHTEACEEALAAALPWLSDGLLPNIFGTTAGESHYGSVDASLWFARCVHLWARAAPGRRERLLDEFLPALTAIAEAYRDGTALGVSTDDGGLLVAGTPELNATWMDAQTPDGPVTPRDGCAVELNALWYSLCRHLEELCEESGDRPALRRWQKLRRRAKRSFLERFWLPDGYLADRWKDGVADPSVRPNMVIAAALELSPLKRTERQGVVERARRDLLTPRGLRTLAPDDPAYRGRYEGGPAERDAAYHQGTVWPWLLGFYVEAHLRAFGAKKADRESLRALWDAFEPELGRAGLNHVSEVFDGDPPHRPGGTIAQAWNTAELLRSCALLAGVGP